MEIDTNVPTPPNSSLPSDALEARGGAEGRGPGSIPLIPAGDHGVLGAPGVRWVVYGALAAAALGGAVFVLAPRQETADLRVEQALKLAADRGATSGAWQIQETHGESRKRTFAEDPKDPSRVLCRFDDAAGRPVLSFPREQVARKLFGDLELFLKNYRQSLGGATETVDGRPTIRFQWSLSSSVGQGPSGQSPARTVWMDDASGDLVGVEDRAYDGALIHSARLLSRVIGELANVAGMCDAACQATPRRAETRGPTIEEVVARASFPVYEPTRLPKGFQRTGVWHVKTSAPESATSRTTLELVRLKYSDGVASIDVWVARPQDLTRFDEGVAKRGGRPGESAACASSPSNGPEDLLADEATTIRRRADKCRTVLLVHPIEGLSVEVIGKNELPQDAYVTAARSLERVKGSKDLAPTAEPTTGTGKTDGPGK